MENPFTYSRFPTRVVNAGGVFIGGNNPICIQSMTSADTNDTEAVVREAIDLFNAGAALVRMTAQGPREAKNLAVIRSVLNERGYTGPLVADIHFSARAAMIAVEHVEKVRINPGNFVDTKRFEHIEYTDDRYIEELERIHDGFRPLVLRSRELGRAMRIGVNHGSLSDRIMSRYGDTPGGMVESAIEFLKIAALHDYHDIVVSMKASNPYVMMQAYRMLVERFRKERMSYPLHLGVTEAGDGRDGRIKSAIGIGSLLLDGIGDTIRVSLTEDAVFEIPAALEILRASAVHQQEDWPKKVRDCLDSLESFRPSASERPYEIARRSTCTVGVPPLDCGGARPVRTAAPLPLDLAPLSAERRDFFRNPPDFFFLDANDLDRARKEFPECFQPSGSLAVLRVSSDLNRSDLPDDCGLLIPSATLKDDVKNNEPSPFLSRLANRQHPVMVLFECENDIVSTVSLVRSLAPVLPSLVVALETGSNPVYPWRVLSAAVADLPNPPPFLLYYRPENEAESLFRVPTEAGSLLLSGLGDVLAVDQMPLPPVEGKKGISSGDALCTVLDILQATRLRITRTEFISCPSCGRTLFDIQEATTRIKAATGHLKGVKIAIMGCVVNGPGEMADADFGYVGAGPGHINLYRGKEVVRKNIPADVAERELIALIRESGRWTDPDSDPEVH